MMMAADVIAVLCALYLALIFRFNTLTPAATFGVNPGWLGAALPLRPVYLLFFIVALLLINYRDGLYGSLRAHSVWHEMRRTLQACLTAGLLLCGVMYFMQQAIAPRALVGYLLGLTTLFLCILRCWWRYTFYRRFEDGLDTRNALIVGASQVGLRRREEQPVARLLKRGCDFAVSFLLLLLLLPTLLLIALCIKLNSPGPVLQASERIGKKGRVFPCFKFRTMTATAEVVKPSVSNRNERGCIPFKAKDAPQLTAVGRVLQKYNMDELPQLLNVLRGDMRVL